jgi:hypothetical protein
MEKNDGYLYFVLYLVKENRSDRASVLMRLFAPWETWKRYRSDSSGWRRSDLEDMRDNGFAVLMRHGEVIPTENILAFGEDMAQRAIAASAYVLANVCYNEAEMFPEEDMPASCVAAMTNLKVLRSARLISRQAEQVAKTADEMIISALQ